MKSEQSKQSREYLGSLLESSSKHSIKQLTDAEADTLAGIAAKPNVSMRTNHTIAPFGVTLYTDYGSVVLNDDLKTIDGVYINGQKFSVNEQGLDAVKKLTGSQDEISTVVDSPVGRQKRGRRARSRRFNKNISMDQVRENVYEDLKHAGITYDSLFDDLNGLATGTDIDVGKLADEIMGLSVDEKDIPHFLAYESQYKDDIASAVSGIGVASAKEDYHFKAQTQDDSFAGRLMKRLGVTDAQYDEEKGVLQIGERKITNLPQVDKNGVFHSNGHEYLPYYVGYFAATGDNRVERLRVSDPVENALSACSLQYKLTGGDIKFKTLLDVSRNLPDFDHHPYGKEILDTMKHKVVLDKALSKTNSLLADYQGKSDELGAVNTMMLDKEAKGIIDPLGTSNGSNMGKIFYLADGVKINDDGSLTPSDKTYSKVGQILSQYHTNRDNFNRNQMSFNAFLTSKDVKTLKVAYAEFAMWNAEDAVVMTKHGAQKAFNEEKHPGDKVMDFHGNKSTISLIADPDMDEAKAAKQHKTQAVKFAQLNPEVDLIVSPVSLASRLNMGVPHEALDGEKEDLHLPNGKTIKDGVVNIMYMDLPQTAEHKSKDYSKEGQGRRYSTLIHYALASKVGDDMYRKALIDPKVRQEHIDQIATAFERMGVSFNDDNKLVEKGNLNHFVDSDAEVDADDLSMQTPAAIRTKLFSQMENGKININLGDMSVKSPLTGETIKDSFGENILPIRVEKGENIPYRYNEVLKAISLGNADHLQHEYDKAVASDYRSLTRKDNLLKNLDTMRFKQDAHTDVLTPDPTLPLGTCRVNMDDDRVLMHRDPAIQSGNVISMHNTMDANPNTIQVNPLIEVMMDADNDGDTLGAIGYSNVHLDDKEKQEFFDKSSMVEQVNQYGRVFLETGDSHFQAAVKANGLNDSNLNFKDGKSNQELVDLTEKMQRQIVDSPTSYGAYGLSFTSDQTLKDSLGRLADDNIKGDKDEIDRIFDNGYTDNENKAVLRALIAKSEWTGLAGATTNNLISGLSDEEFDPKLVRVSMDVTHSMTQSVLQMKKNAEKLPQIDQGIKDMKSVMSGKYNTETSRTMLKSVTQGLLEPEAIDKFVDEVAAKQTDSQHFGSGVINRTEMNTTKLAYENSETFSKALNDLSHTQEAKDTLNR